MTALPVALPATAAAAVVRATLPPPSSSQLLLTAALAAALAALLLAAVPAHALYASLVFRPLVDLRFELATIGVCILVGIAVAKALPGT